MIKSIIFDFGGVYFQNGTKFAIERISQEYHLDPAQVKAVLKGSLGFDYRVGKVTAEEFWHKAMKEWGVETESKKLATMWLSAYKPILGMPELIDQLKQAGYELLYLSDNVQERVDYLNEKYNFLNKFKDGVFSHNVGTRKPDTRIYQMVLAKASHQPEECVYIDDHEELLEPAKKMGLETIHFKNIEQLKKELNKLEIKF